MGGFEVLPAGGLFELEAAAGLLDAPMPPPPPPTEDEVPFAELNAFGSGPGGGGTLGETDGRSDGNMGGPVLVLEPPAPCDPPAPSPVLLDTGGEPGSPVGVVAIVVGGPPGVGVVTILIGLVFGTLLGD